MMNPVIVQCNACGGLYRPIQHDGTEYFHACPPVRVVVSAVVDPKTGDVLTPAVVAPIANRRDENVAHVDKAGVVTIKSVGAGVSPVLDPAVIAAAGFSAEA